MRIGPLLRRPVALPGDHGSWVFLLCPLVIGLVAGRAWSTVASYLVVAALAGFLLRQPITVAVKVAAGRRGAQELPAALFWSGLYAGIGLLHVIGLTIRGYGYVLYLPLLGVPVFTWYLYLVYRHRERRQLVVELAATAVVSLSAAAGYWIGQGHASAVGWLLALLVWLQTAASIVAVHLRLERRRGGKRPLAAGGPGRSAWAALALTSSNLVAVLLLATAGLVPRWLFLAYVPQWLVALADLRPPAAPLRPTSIGLRQLAISTAYTAVFLLAW